MTAMSHEPRHARRRTWPLLLIAAPAAVAVWSGWVGLGALCGFGEIRPLPGIASWHIDTAITLPVGVESYGAYALWAWLASAGASATTRMFARASAVGALALGCLGQVAYHLLAADHDTRAPGLVVVLVACLPVVTLSFAAALTHLMRADAKAAEQAQADARQKAEERAAARAAKAAESGAPERAVRKPSAPAIVTAGAPAKALSPTAAKRAKATELLSANPAMTTADVKKQSGASDNTILRIRREMAEGQGGASDDDASDSGVPLHAVR